jgi:glutamyl-tRNA synthetase
MDRTGEVRTRLAPSPTGDPHVGTAYQALFDYVWARKNGGKFVLRIEDTDRDRSTPDSERAILDSLRWLGLEWDEGPDIGGPFGPYRQSERVHIYREHADRLLNQGDAYPCFCSKERLEEVRSNLSEESASNRGYDRRCRDIPPSDAAARVRAGEPHVVRMKVPLEGECVWKDLLRGEIRKDWASIDDQVILKADGYPTYHLAVVVDDHLMEISHIIRGEEWINSVPKHVLLYGFLGWEPPVFCHLPLLRNRDRSKLSKRKNPVSVNYYRRAGFLPEALLNYLGMMGWSMPGGEEKFTVAEMIGSFELEAVSLGGPVFDRDKLRWLNGRYIREDLTPGDLLDRLCDWGLNRDYAGRIAGLVQGRLETLGDWGEMTVPFFADGVSPDPGLLTLEGFEADELAGVMQKAVWDLERLGSFDSESIEGLFRDSAERLGVKLRDLTRPFYVAVTGRTVSAPLFGAMEIIGSDMVRMRIMAAIESLGGISGKRLRKLEKEYESELASRE